MNSIVAIVSLLVASTLGAGILFKHERWFTFVATIITLFSSQWMLLTLLGRSLYIPASITLLLGWAVFYKKWRMPKWQGKYGLHKELAVAAVLLVTISATALILSRNGFQSDLSTGAEQAWVMHGFYNGDTTTLASLVETMRNTSDLNGQNPFFAQGALEYPVLLHAAIADLLPEDWLKVLPIIMYLQLLATVPLFFLLWDVVNPEPKEEWKRWFSSKSRRSIITIQALLVFYVMALSWDAFVYPQSHFFLTNLFLLEVAILIIAQKLKGKQQVLPVAVSSLIALVLMFANAVTGTAAVAVIAVFYLLRSYDKSRAKEERVLFLSGIPVFAILFLFFTPGNGALGIIPGFSYTAAIDMLRLAPIALALALGIFWYLVKYPFLNWAAGALMALAFVTYIFSTRDIVVENASRFFFHAILIAFPLLMYPLMAAIGWLKRELVHSNHKLTEYAIGWIVAGSAMAFFLLPALASGASTHDNLMLKNRQVVSAAELSALDWIKENTSPTDVFVMAPDFPWTVPFFTGRPLLRTNYWLSIEDELTGQVNDAFNGNLVSQKKIIGEADYVFLRTPKERLSWSQFDQEVILENDDVTIYRLEN